jgi:hypothetical protein
MSEQEGQTPENTNPPVEGNDGVSPSAIEALGEERIGGDTPPQPETDSPSDQQERSRLGRRFTKFEQEMADLKSQLSTVVSTLTMTQRAMQPAEKEVLPEYVTTPQDVDMVIEAREKKLARQRDQYATGYIHAVGSLRHLNPDLHTEIENELLTNVGEYPTYSKHQDPVSDARVNYMKAENKLLKSRLNTAPKPNVRGGNNAPTGLSGGDRVVNPPKPTIELDPYAKSFLKSLGEDASADWVQNSLGRK